MDKKKAKKVQKKKPAGDMTAFLKKKPVRKIVNFYYFPAEGAGARQIVDNVGPDFAEKADIWPELNLVEVVLNLDSLIFQDAAECFVDPLDQEYFKEHGITTMFQISFDINDLDQVKQVMKNIMGSIGGRVCSDTDDFEPSYDVNTIENLNV